MKGRPLKVPLPNIWSKFERNRNETKYIFEIREPFESEFDLVMQFLTKYYMKEESLNKALGISQDVLAIEQYQFLLRRLFKYNYHLICFDVTDPTNPIIASANMLVHISKKNVKSYESVTVNAEPIKKLIQMMIFIKKSIDIFLIYDVDEYLGGAGMSTDPAYRKMGLASELIVARELLCKALGIEVTSAYFTSITSQKIAEKYGYETLLEMDYTELGRIFNVNFDTETPTLKVMAQRFLK